MTVSRCLTIVGSRNNVPLLLLGVPLALPPESEEVAGFFGAMLDTDHAQDATFRANFFRDFKLMLDQYPPVSAKSGCLTSYS